MASVEYMLLMCSMVTITCLTAYFLKNYVDVLVDKITDMILGAVFTLGS